MVKRLIVDFGRSNEGSRRGRWEMTSFDLAVIVRMGGRVGERVGGAGLGGSCTGSLALARAHGGGGNPFNLPAVQEPFLMIWEVGVLYMS